MRKMKIRLAVLALSISIGFILLSLDGYALGGGSSASEGSIEVVLTSNPFDVRNEVNNWHYVTMEGFANIGEPGEPDLPVRTYKFILPPSADLGSVTIEVLETQGRILDYENYDVNPGGPFFLSSDPETLNWGEGKNIVDGKNVNVYGKDAPYPSSPVKLLGVARMRKWKFAAVRFTPFQYNPVEKTLSLYKAVKVRIRFRTDTPDPDVTMADTVFDGYAEELFDNFENAKPWYAADVPVTYVPEAEYVICTTDAVNTSGCLNAFITHKQSMGFTTEVWTGSDPLSWLQSNYAAKGIKYVLILATVGTIKPGPGTGTGDEADIRYVDLNDGSHSTVRAPELFVGRVNSNDTAYIGNYLAKVIAYETATTDIDYRKKFYMTDDLKNTTSTDYSGVTYDLEDTFFEQIADTAGFASGGAGGSWLASNWPGNPCGAVMMRGHGSTFATMSLKFKSTHIAALNDSKPGFAFVETCLAGKWGCLLSELIANGGIAVMANNNYTWGHFGWKNKSFEVKGASSLAYFAYYRLMVEKAPIGDAFHMGRFIYGSDYSAVEDINDNYISYHLKGDPSVGLVLPEDISSEPTITSDWVYWVRSGRAYREKIVARGGKYPYTWEIIGSLPAGLSIDPDSGMISGTSSAEGTHTFTAKITDADSKTAAKELWLDVADYGDPGKGATKPELKIITSKLPDANKDQFYAYTLIAQPLYFYNTYYYGTSDFSDSNVGEHFNWEVTGGTPPAGMIIRKIGGCIRGTFTTTGTYTFTITVTGAQSDRVASREFTLDVVDGGGPQPLEVVTTSLPDGSIDQAYSASLTAQGGTTPYSWSLQSGSLPTGISLSTGGSFTGTPTVSGDFSITVQVTDGAAATATKDLTINISAGPPPDIEITTVSPLPNGVVNVAYSASLEATGGVPPYDWIVISGSLPAGVDLSHSGVFSGTPTTEGVSTFTVQLGSASADIDTKEFTIEILPEGSLAITTSSMPSGEVGDVYSANIEIVGGIPSLTWSVSSGSLPPGLNLEAATGAVSGAPTAAGTYIFTARVDDGGGAFATRLLSIEITQTGSSPSAPIIMKKKKNGGCALSGGSSEPGAMIPYTILILVLAAITALRRRKTAGKSV